MDGAEIPASGQIPLLDSHDRSTIQKQLGSTREIRVEGEQLVGRNFISEAEQDAATKVREGHVTDLSIGYRVINFIDIPPGQSQEVKGKTYTAGDRTRRISTKWIVKENSLLPIGADEMAKVRAQMENRTTTRKEVKKMTNFQKWLAKLEVDEANLNEDTEEEFRRLFKLDKSGGGDSSDDPPEDPPAEIEAETRAREIRAM
ncbi:MAG TPA: hypothetical protein VM492_05180, partial [Sumerlaeia bacterium]|nr:hypothetical protein [Sumerlaeia bacterium]